MKWIKLKDQKPKYKKRYIVFIKGFSNENDWEMAYWHGETFSFYRDMFNDGSFEVEYWCEIIPPKKGLHDSLSEEIQ